MAERGITPLAGLGTAKPSRLIVERFSKRKTERDEGGTLTVGMKSLTCGVTAALLALLILMIATLTLPVERADAAKMTACVNKKTGAMKMVFGNQAKKKCPKGYKKVTWNSQGPAGPNLSVYDSNDQRVGRFLGIQTLGFEVPLFQVAREGGIYSYLGSGTLLPSNALGGQYPVSYKTNDCTGDPYVPQAGVPPQFYLDFLTKSLAGMNRIVFRTIEAAGFGVPKAWVGNETYEMTPAAGIPLYEIDPSGACVSEDPAFAGILLGLDEVSIPTPYDFDGPLEVR